MNTFPLFPEQASTLAPQVDYLYFFLLAVSGFFTVLICLFILYFIARYRRREGHRAPASRPGSGMWLLEVVWIGIPLLLVMVMFFWGAHVYYAIGRQPADALEIFAVGKQWMWKLQHADGRREINELHVPVGQRVKVVLASQDVIHSFFIPAFRIKQDAVPGMYTTVWFEATRPGEYHLFCAEYCGTSHSKMVGRVVVMAPAEFQTWLAGGGGETPVQRGERAFQKLGCITCHAPGAGAGGPNLNGLYGRRVQLQDGSTALADENYLRRSILDPAAQVTAGFQPVMPSFRGLVTEDQLLELVAYLRTLRDAPYLENRRGSHIDNGTSIPGQELPDGKSD